ncbi:putative membrane protein [Proteiniphilum saccharofermentans]|uniref:Putative membrane protein n=1 Tax=Proteiniphilum saccharofermentans TaxID=1642647 RepID=A0A1R3T3G2_9BACT|nr:MULTISPECIES: T9SS sorting signal type C domain-containing protein [Proteiniphilum]SCD19798.1 putative membrane protein [Proteiniphilum saccharofermentans]SFK92425.1 PKD domain-containing protein [Porphyromonadaceae bacterium KH3CP3RA]
MKFENTKSIGYGDRWKHVFSRMFLMVFLAVFSFSLYAQDSDNTEFWFVAPDASKSHADRPTFLMITTGDKPATVTISMPKNKYFKSRTDTIMSMDAKSHWKFEFKDVQVDSVENTYTSSGKVTDKGILITSTAPISAYYQIDGGNQKEIFTLKGKKALGEDFYMPFQQAYVNSGASYKEDAFRQIQIVASEDETEVTVVPANGNLIDLSDNSIVNSGSSKTKKLNKGQTLLWRGEKFDTQLTGSRVTSTKPIAVTLFEDCNSVVGQSSIDPIGDQMVPVNKLGQNYIVVKGFSYGGNVTDHVGVLAVEDNTVIKVGDFEEQTLQKGKYYSWNLGVGATNPQAYSVTSNRPVYCMHQSAAGSEVGGSLLPSLYSISARRITFFKGDMNINSMFLVFRESAKDGFVMDGDSLKVTVGEVGFEDWRYAKVDIKASGGNRVCTIENDKGAFSLGYFLGAATTSSLYGYFSAFGTFSFESDVIAHCGDSYTFSAPYAKSYKWLYNGEEISNEATFVATKSGEYTLTVDQDQYKITDKTYLKLQNFSHILSAPEQLLENKAYNFTIKLNPDDDPDNYFSTTYLWNFGEGASVPTSTEAGVEVFYSSSGTKNISLTIWNHDANCDTTITRTIEVLDKSEGIVLYWRTDTKDRDWNNVKNWAKDPEGQNPIEVIPADYTKVYLPGKAANYPSLTQENTDWTHYGQPEADEIVFRYGSELHYQHELKYNKAYINYNWGYYGDSPASGQQPPLSLENAEILQRDAWHILAAPLKSMASGDFSLAGRPFSWQTQFTVTTPGSVAEGDLSEAFPTNDVALATTNNAIAVKMAGYESGKVGHKDQTNLEGLKGVIEIPYFENESLKAHYTAHNYDALAKKSYFYYFDTRTLKLLNSPLGSMSRSDEAYRFVYETELNEPPSNAVYEMPLNTEGMGDSNEVMVGNPFLAPIDAKAFAEENTENIDDSQGYKLLSEDEKIWEQHYFTEGSIIPAWKAFIVTVKPNVTTLSFPFTVTLPSQTENEENGLDASVTGLRSGSADGALSVHIQKAGIESGDCAILQNNRNTNNTEIRKMILPEGHEAPEIFFMSSGGDLSYLVRNLGQGENEVPIGVKTSDVHSCLALEFRNIAAFTASTGAKAILVDKHLNVRQDLVHSPVYRFTQQASGLDKQYVDKNRFVLQLGGETGTIGQEDPEDGINIMYRSGILKVTSDENIDAVSVYDLYGRLVFSVHSVNLSQYTHPIALQGKLFLVRVKTASGKEKVKKIMGN